MDTLLCGVQCELVSSVETVTLKLNLEKRFPVVNKQTIKYTFNSNHSPVRWVYLQPMDHIEIDVLDTAGRCGSEITLMAYTHAPTQVHAPLRGYLLFDINTIYLLSSYTHTHH